MALTQFEIGKLKIAAHAREELDRAGIQFQSIQCKSGGTHTHPDIARLIVTVEGAVHSLDFNLNEVEDCAAIVAGEPWRKIAALIGKFDKPPP